jgi:hypothetical protein
MNLSVLVRGGFLLLLAGCSAPATAPLNLNEPAFAKSVVGLSPALREDAMRSLREWAKAKFSCDSLSVRMAESVSVKGDVTMDSRGRLHSGIVDENWSISRCGVRAELFLVFMPDGKGGTYIAIGDLPSTPK